MFKQYDIRITTTAPVVVQVAPGPNEISRALRVVPTALRGAIRQNYRLMFGVNTPAEAAIFGDMAADTGSAGALLIKDDFRFEGTPELQTLGAIDHLTGAGSHFQLLQLRAIPAGTTIIGTVGVRTVPHPHADMIVGSLIASLSHAELRLGGARERGYGTAHCEIIDLDHIGEVFVSYTHEDEDHSSWVLSVAERLHRYGFQIIFDKYDLKYGDNLHVFMEQAVSRSKKVLLILTPEYKRRATSRQGGAGYEFSMILSQLVNDLSNNSKVVPILRKGSADESVPLMLKPYLYCDVRDDRRFEENLSTIVTAVLGKPQHERPPSRRPNA